MAQTEEGAVAPWTTDVDDDNLPTAAGRHFRVTATVTAEGMAGVRDLPVQQVFDLASILAEGGHPAEQADGRVVLQGFELDLESFLLHEVDGEGRLLERLPILVFPGSVTDDMPFDAQRNPVVTLRWILSGQTVGPRHFAIYFDAVHNGATPAPPLDAADEAQLVVSVGPGRGTTHYVPLQPLSGAQLQGERRWVMVTALHGGTDVSFYEYRGGIPRPDPISTVQGLQAGQVSWYQLGSAGNQPSEGSVKVVSTRPTLVEAFFSDGNPLFVPNGFVPSTDGGFLGQSFLATPHHAETWHVFCPKVSAKDLGNGQDGCRFSVNGQAPQNLGPNRVWTTQVPAAPATTTLQAQVGSLLVQRAGTGLAFWPPADGPALASQFLGHAGKADQLALTAVEGSTCVLVQSRASGNILADKDSGQLCLPEAGLLQDSLSWGTTLSRDWETGHEHEEGPLRVESFTGSGVGIASGPINHPTNFNSLVVPQSPDGGFTYRIHVPASSSGTPVGNIALFALQDSTSGTAVAPGREPITIPGLREGERFVIREAGWWTITMQRPVVAAWLVTGAIGNFGAYAPGFTNVASVEVTGADFAGHVLGAQVQGSSFLQQQPGDLAQFTLRVTNHARDTEGRGLPDRVHVRLEAPDGWTTDVRPATRELGPGGSGEDFSLQANIPKTVNGAGATLRAVVTSEANPELEVDQILQISYVIRHGVEVREVNNPAKSQVEKNIGLEDTAGYVLRITNIGSAPDSFDLDVSKEKPGWIQKVTPLYEGDASKTPELDPGEFVELALDVAPGPEVHLASKHVTRFSATSSADRSVTDSLRIDTIVGVERSFRVVVDAPTRTVDPGEGTTFNVTVINDAEVNEELRVDLVSSLPPGWPDATVVWLEENTTLPEVDHTIRLDAGGSATLVLTREVPSQALPLSLSVDRLRIQSQFDRDSPPSDLALRVLAATLRGVQADLDVPAHTVDPGDEVELSLTLTSGGNVDQTFRVVPLLPPSWNATDADGDGPPWDVPVPAFGSTVLDLVLRVPTETPPGETPVPLALSAFGVDTAGVEATLDVNQRAAVAVEDGTFRLDPGRLLALDAPVRNVGNTEVFVEAAWTGLPDWDVSTEPLRLGPGTNGTLRTWIQVPADIPEDTLVEARIEVTAGGDATDVADWTLSTNVPRLEASVQGVRASDGDQASYIIQVRNVGLDAAHNVSVLLDDEGAGTVDRFVFNQILPGVTSTAVLLGPADAGGVTLRVVADHDPEGILLTVDDDREPGGPRGLLTPAPALPPLLALLGLAVATRRWRS